MHKKLPPEIALKGEQVGHWFAVLRNKLFAGIIVAIPIVATIWVFNLAYKTLAGISAPLLRAFGIDFLWVHFLITLALFFLLGVMATHVIGRKILEASEKLLLRVPVAATIYGAVKQIMDSIKTFGSGVSFKRVVFVEYPVPGCRLIGFVTGQHVMPGSTTQVTTVFLPTAPNPMTGFVLVVESDKVIESNLGMDDATKMILSAGLVGPGVRSEGVFYGVDAAPAPAVPAVSPPAAP